MTSLEWLNWVRGPGFLLASGLCVFGIVLRLFEILALGRKRDLFPPRIGSPGSGWLTVFSRSLPLPGMLKRAPLTYVGGYVFHIGLAIAIFCFAPHIESIRGVLGFVWPGLPNPIIDIATMAAMLAMIAVLTGRIVDPVKRFLSGFGDWLAWGLTFLPLATGFAAYHHLFPSYTFMLALHIFSAEVMFALLPFTKLFHVVSLFMARWYNGDAYGRRGVAS